MFSRTQASATPSSFKMSEGSSIEKRVDDADETALYAETESMHGLKRELKNRHAQMISIGGVIGTGLFLGTAGSLATGGPGGLLLGYLIMSSVCVCVMLSLGELVSFLPVPGGQVTLSGRFVDPAFSFALGWNLLYAYMVLLPAELSAAAVLINYWNQTVNNAAWITICIVVVVTINFFGTRVYGETEFWFASIKVITIVGLIIAGLVIDLGGAPDRDRRGFRFWHHPGPFTQFHGIAGSKGRFLSFWSVLIQAAYAFLGTEVIGITAAETRNPAKNIPRAIRGVYIRIVIFYILSVFILGLICPSDNIDLTKGTGTVASSAWVIAIRLSGIKALPSIINACLLTSAWSAASSDMYTSSRLVYGLARNGQAPKFFTKVNRFGTPWAALLLSTSFSLLAYMGVKAGSSKVFGWFANMSAIAGMLNWMGICVTNIRFRKGIKAQGLSLDMLPFKSKLQPFAAWWALSWTVVIILFVDWSVFLSGEWDHASFITNYLPVPLFLIYYVGYKFLMKSKAVSPEAMDFVTYAHTKN